MQKVFINQKGGDNMQFQTLKAVKNSDSRFHIVIASIAPDEEGKHKAILTIADKKKPKSRYEASNIHIIGRNKETVYQQIREIAEIPICEDEKVGGRQEREKD